MAVVNQQLKDDNSHGSGGSTSSIHEIARVNASFDAEMEREIRPYPENMWPMICVNGGSTSLIDELTRVSALTENSSNRSSTSRSESLQLQFINGISTPVSTGNNIEGSDHKPLVVALIDQSSGKIVRTGAEASTEVEIVVLVGNCNDNETENWTCDEFNKKMVREWKGKKVLQGNTFLKLKEGIVSVNKISFTHNSAWKGNRICRLGARSKDAVFANWVKEAKTESFPVMDKRKLLYNKHPTPSSSDHVYRLNKINRRSACFTRLKAANIKTVMDLRALHAINPNRLKDILNVHLNTWKIIVNHAEKCKDDKGIYLYSHPRDDQKKEGVVFNVSGQLVGLVADSHFLPTHELHSDKKADAEKLVQSASEHWEEVVPFNDEASLINHLQSGSGTTLNLVIPHTNRITPVSPSENDWISEIAGVMPTGQPSQSPKRPAPQHTVSNSPKKPRDNHHQTTLFTPSVPTNNSNDSSEASDGDEYLQFLDFSQLDNVHALIWKKVWCVVGWISIFSKVRKRQITSDNSTLIGITA